MTWPRRSLSGLGMCSTMHSRRIGLADGLIVGLVVGLLDTVYHLTESERFLSSNIAPSEEERIKSAPFA